MNHELNATPRRIGASETNTVAPDPLDERLQCDLTPLREDMRREPLPAGIAALAAQLQAALNAAEARGEPASAE